MSFTRRAFVLAVLVVGAVACPLPDKNPTPPELPAPAPPPPPPQMNVEPQSLDDGGVR